MTARTIADRIFKNEKIKKLGEMAAAYGQDHMDRRVAIEKVLLEPLMGGGIVSVAGIGPIMAYACAQAIGIGRVDDVIARINEKVGGRGLLLREAGLIKRRIVEFAAEYDPRAMEEIGLVGIMALNKTDIASGERAPAMNGVYVARERAPLRFDVTQKANIPQVRRNIDGEFTKAEFEIRLTAAGIRNIRGASSTYKTEFRTFLDEQEVVLYEWLRGLLDARDYTFGRASLRADEMNQLPEGHVAIELGLPEGLQNFVAVRQFRGLLRNGVLVLGNYDVKGGIFDNVSPNPETYWLY